MSHFTKSLIGNYKPLWKRKIPPYPVYWKGDPQLRVFLPLFWMKLLKPKQPVPENQVHFEVHPQMSRKDIKNYLEKIYKVPVADVKVHNKEGDLLKHRFHNSGKKDDQRFAYITLGEGCTYTVPKIMKDGTQFEKIMKDGKERENDMKRYDQKKWDRLNLPPWFR